MPGIAGILTTRSFHSRSKQLDIMLDMIGHKTNDTKVIYENVNLGVYVGCVNVENSVADCMPIWNERNDKLLLLSGECVTDRDVLAQLSSRGHMFNTHNLEWVIHSYEDQEKNLFPSLNGAYCGVIVDIDRGCVYIFNDRYGQRRIYYHQDREDIYFASEAKSLLKILPQTRYIDSKALAQYLEYECVIGDRTLFRDIHVLSAGSIWTWDSGHLDRGRVYDTGELENQAMLDSRSFASEFESIFSRILPRYHNRSCEMLSLSGGHDTRMIFAFLDVMPGELSCYSHAGMYREMLDVKIARSVAEMGGQTHTTIQVDESFLKSFPDYAAETVFVTDGLAHVCQSHLLYCNRLAREIGRIKISGKYGSQVLKGVSAFRRPTGYNADIGLVCNEIKQEIDESRLTFSKLSEGHPLSVMVFREIPWWWAGITAIENSQLDVRSPYLDNELVALMFRSPMNRHELSKLQMELVLKRNRNLYSIMSDKGVGGPNPTILGLPQRLYYRLLNLTGKIYERDKLPASLHHSLARIDKYLFKQIGLDVLLLGLVGYTHYRTWFRDQLADYIQEMLLDSMTLSRSYWKRRFLITAVQAHMQGKMNYLTEIRKVLTIELVERYLIGIR